MTNRSDSEFMKRSQQLHCKSHDPDRQVGALIVGRDGTVLAEGSNAPPVALGLSMADSLAAIGDDPNWKYFVLEHAERNAIFAAFAAGKELRGATMYGTLYPCADCARAIVAAGIARLVVPMPASDTERNAKWLQHYQFAHRILELGGVEVSLMPGDAPAAERTG